MHFSDQFLDEVVARNDIADVVSSYVTLTRKGGNLFGLCPFHNEKTPSFSVAPDKQIYHCFGCGKGGSVISFIMEIENLSFPEAVAFLANRAGMQLPEQSDDPGAKKRQRLLALNRDAARFFHAQLKTPTGQIARDYLARRQLTAQTVTRFGLGFRYFCNVDSAEHWVQIHDGYVRQGRRNIDGYRMYYQSNLLDDLFDTKTVWDDARPTPVPKI